MKKTLKQNHLSAIVTTGRMALVAGAATLIMGMLSCKKDSADSASPTMVGGYFTAITQAHSSDGKTYLDGREVKWNGGERVRIFNGLGESGVFYAMVNSDDAKSADLKISTDYAYTPDYLAVYPEGEYSYDKDTKCVSDFELSNLQEYVNGGFAPNTNPMAAYSKGPDANNTVKLQFENLCGLLRFQLTGHKETLSYIVIRSNDGTPLSGKGTITVNEENIPVLSINEGDEYIKLDCNGVELNTTPKTFCVLLPPCTLKDGFSMEILNESGVHVCTKYVTTNTEIIASKIYDVKHGDSDILDILPRDLSYHEGEDGTAGWSETANCYIVKGAGIYMFPCTVKGNGRKATGNCASYLGEHNNPIITVGENYKADVVWRTKNDLTDEETIGTAIVDEVTLVDYIYITFRTDGTPGNALIALKDADDNIVWSWHIWCVDPDDAPEAVYGTSFMDRILGALSSTPGSRYNAGFFYQWGRKDPLFGIATYNTGVSAEEAALFNNIDKTTRSMSVMQEIGGKNVTQSIQFPQNFILCSVPKDWFANSEGTYSNGMWSSQKTMFDPCPAGWKVLDRGMMGNGGTYPLPDWTYNESEAGYYYNSLFLPGVSFLFNDYKIVDDGTSMLWTNLGLETRYARVIQATKTQVGTEGIYGKGCATTVLPMRDQSGK